jgi:hypothetical protein
MTHKILRSGTYVPQEGEDMSELKTRYFADGSAIIVTEKGVGLLERRTAYKGALQDPELKGESSACENEDRNTTAGGRSSRVEEKEEGK